MSVRRILIVGGSTRAAADSVRRAGWHPVCADLFADQDLRKTAEVVPVRSYPDSLPDDVRCVHADGWFYCGALENRPDILQQIEQANGDLGPLMGTPAATLRLVRDPLWVANTLRSASLEYLQVKDQASPPELDGSWIQKPLASAGGRSIRVWNQTALDLPFHEPHYFQRKAIGTPMSVIFRIENRQFKSLTVSMEIEADPASNPPTAFAYCGSIGTATVSAVVWKQLTAIIAVIIESAPGLNGLVGLDFRLSQSQVGLTEINPRYTASVEVAELATGDSMLNPEVHASRRFDQGTPARFAGQCVAKQILYAASQFTAPDLGYLAAKHDEWEIPWIADVPVPGSAIDAGWPICTVLAVGTDEEDVRRNLRSRMERVRALLAEE